MTSLDKKREGWKRKEARKKARKLADPEYAERQRELQRARNYRFRAKNPEAYKAQNKIKNRPGYDPKYMRQLGKAWCEKNPERVAYHQAKAAISKSLGIPSSLVANDVVEAKVAQMKVLRAVRKAG